MAFVVVIVMSACVDGRISLINSSLTLRHVCPEKIQSETIIKNIKIPMVVSYIPTESTFW